MKGERHLQVQAKARLRKPLIDRGEPTQKASL
jgi:hypothetical protein